MTIVAFDTLAYAKKLKEGGFTEQQAEAQASALAEAFKESGRELATKADLDQLEARLKAEIIGTKADLLKWFVGLLFLQAGFIVALIKLL